MIQDSNKINLSPADIIKAVIEKDWGQMLKLCPEGVEHRGLNKTIEDFEDWDTYETFARYVEPARTKLIDKCLQIAYDSILKKPCDPLS